MRKQVGVKVIFENEYTDTERNALWGQFFYALAELKDKQKEVYKKVEGTKLCKIY